MTRIFRFVHSVIFWFLIFFYAAVINTYSCVAALFIKDKKKKKLFYQKGAKLWGSLLANASLVKVKVSGLENIPDNANVIFTPNHQSYLDIFILLKYLPCPFEFIIMRKLFDVPVIGSYITRAGFLSLDRKDKKNSIRTIYKIVDLLREGESFAIFPEGRLTENGNIGEFGRGTSIVIQRSRKPVIPIAIDGNFSVLPKGAWKLYPKEVKVTIGKPVYFENYYNDINKKSSMEVANRLRDIVISLKG